MSTKKFFEFKLSRLQALVTLFSLIGCIVLVFVLGAFTGRRFFPSTSPPAGSPTRQSLLPDNSVSDYGTFESLNTTASEAGKPPSPLSFYETLPQNGASPSPHRTDLAKSKVIPPSSAPQNDAVAKLPGATPGAATHYTIQIAAFRQKEKALALADNLTKRGYRTQVTSTTSKQGDSWHRVKVGRFNTPEEAKLLLPALSEISAQPLIVPSEE